MAIYLPKQLKELYILDDTSKVNPSLLLSKYAQIKTKKEEEKAKEIEKQTGEKNTYSFDIAKYSCEGKSRSQKILRYSSFPKAKMVAMKLGGRLIIDQSGGVQENSNLCLHPHFGFPMIPGSAIKGCARHFLWEQWGEGVEENKLDIAREKARDLIEIFGYPTGDDGRYKVGQVWKKRELNLDDWCEENLAELVLNKDKKKKSLAGKITFFPAMPYGSAPLEVDVLTCHHMDYYSPNAEKARATDDENPNPQFFPVVKAGATFEIVVAPTTRGNDSLAEKALEVLQTALEVNGIGAKTAAGYGWFEVDEEIMRKQSLSPFDLKREEVLEKKQADAIDDILKSDNLTAKKALVSVLINEWSEYWEKQSERTDLSSKGKKRIKKCRKLADELGEKLR